MDLLGEDGEKALEGVENVSRRVEKLESHLTAVDRALQNFMQRSRHLLEEEYGLEEKELDSLEKIENLADFEEVEIENLENRITAIEEQQRDNRDLMQDIVESGLISNLYELNAMVKRIRKNFLELNREVDDVKDRLEVMENKTFLELNKREYDFNQKLDRKEFEDREDELYEEIKKLRASVNILAEDLDKKGAIEERRNMAG
jgi:hypothetical protein